jgi:HEAT repeat protein
MHHDDALVWRAAKNVLSDIVHRVGTTGHEKERRKLAEMLKATALNNGPHHARKHALRLLGVAAPEGFRVRELNHLAKDETWRGETISALVIMGTDDARKVLNGLLNYGTGAQRAEIIEALRLVTPDSEAPVSTKFLKDDDIEVRVAAMRALAQTGDYTLAARYPKAMQGSDGRLHTEAIDACLQLAQRLSKNEGTKAVANTLLKWVGEQRRDEDD